MAWVDHPYYLPNFSNAIAFTFPFVVENCTLLRLRRFLLIPPVMKILADVMTAIGEIGFEQQQQQTEYMDDAQLMEELAQKRVRAMGRIAIMMKKMRLEREANIKRLEAKSAFPWALLLTIARSPPIQRMRNTILLLAWISRMRSALLTSGSATRPSEKKVRVDTTGFCAYSSDSMKRSFLFDNVGRWRQVLLRRSQSTTSVKAP